MRKSALFWFGLVVTALVALGLVILASASEANAYRLHGDVYFFIKRQSLYLIAGIVVAVLASLFDYHKWRDYEFLSWAFFVVVLILLVVVFKFPAINGSHRWISLGPIRLQPSELAKMLTVILLAELVMIPIWQECSMPRQKAAFQLFVHTQVPIILTVWKL